MTTKQRIAAPIDRPLAKAYVREFTGWYTDAPPGLAEPNSFRLMENVLINRDGSAGVRPAMRSLLSWADFDVTESEYPLYLVGGFEHFYIGGIRAILFAARWPGHVGFLVGRWRQELGKFSVLTLTQAGFTFEPFASEINFPITTTYVKYLQIDNRILALSNDGEPFRLFEVGTDLVARHMTRLPDPSWDEVTYGAVTLPNETPAVFWPSTTWSASATLDGDGPFKAEVQARTGYTPVNWAFDQQAAADGGLVSDDTADNTNNMAFYYSFENDLGETMFSPSKIVKIAKVWTSWDITEVGAGTEVANPVQATDQLVVIPPIDVFQDAVAAGATRWSVYAFYWSENSAVPTSAIKMGTKSLEGASSSDTDFRRYGWQVVNPILGDLGLAMDIPQRDTMFNSSHPSTAINGVVAGDRLVLVSEFGTTEDDNAARVRWSSNRQGEYLSFSSVLGGGYKTLTSGNLYVPSVVKLWQNPSSVDTLTILNRGVDGYTSAYYMAPSEIATSSSSVDIMGFEETTGTQGTVSPFGCEVVNNALYHPVDGQLVKTTIGNYNINNVTIQDKIDNRWKDLINMEAVVSCEWDNRIYYLVHNPFGEALELGARGNEVWVVDVSGKGGPIWSRFLIQGCSLKKVETLGNRVSVCVIRTKDIVYLDDRYAEDELVTVFGDPGVAQGIPWRLETNTQGANRAHDAWCHLQQMQVVFANFQGKVRYGVKFQDSNGTPCDFQKEYQHFETVDLTQPFSMFDWSDYLQIKRNAMDWRFYAESVVDAEGQVVPSMGRISYLQYRYAPISVNVGYEYGSIETFEYGSNVATGNDAYTDGGIPAWWVDTSRP